MRKSLPSVFLLPTLFLPLVSGAATYVVRPDGTGDFRTIQAAIDAAVDGDIIELTDGIFLGDGNRDVAFLGKAITVRSQGRDPSTCIIDCEGRFDDNHRAFSFVNGESEPSTLEGVTIRNGVTSPMESSPLLLDAERAPCLAHDAAVGRADRENEYLGGAILCAEGAAPTIRRCIFTNNVSDFGGAIGLDSAHPIVVECLFDHNRAQWGWGDGGAIGAGNLLDGQVTLRDSHFFANSAVYHGAAVTVSGGKSLIVDCTFLENTAHSGGAFFGCREADTEIVGCSFWRNSAVWGGVGVY